jgi:hypothetical protein
VGSGRISVRVTWGLVAGRLAGMDPRNVLLGCGDVRWVFPILAEVAELDAVCHALAAADELIFCVGQVLGARPDAEIGGVPMNRFYYQRLGPEPDYPVSILIAEGGSDTISVSVLCLPGDPDKGTRRSAPLLEPGPPWWVDAAISVSCDSDPMTCAGHDISTWSGMLQQNPVAAAEEVMAAAAWLRDLVANETEESLRARDPNRGHTPVPRRRD